MKKVDVTSVQWLLMASMLMMDQVQLHPWKVKKWVAKQNQVQMKLTAKAQDRLEHPLQVQERLNQHAQSWELRLELLDAWQVRDKQHLKFCVLPLRSDEA